MEIDAPFDSQQLDGVAPSSSAQPSSGKDGGKDPERFYCPYPGCNRSFAELWRLKVHFRAPPDIRGSGKERGHGTELTHCPKCGKTLKPGKHHVGCSGSKTNARQPNKRSRAGGDAEPPDEAPTSSHTLKPVKGDGELETLAPLWADYARSHALHSLGLQPQLKQEQQEWTATMQPGILYGPNGTATACWLQGQVNGFVPQLSPQGFLQPQFTAELQFPSSAHGYAQQVPSFPGLHGYPQAALGLAQHGQVLPLQAPNGNLQQVASMPGLSAAPGLQAVSSLLYHQPPHSANIVQPAHAEQRGQQAATPLGQVVPALTQGQPQPLQQPQQPTRYSADGQHLTVRATTVPSEHGVDGAGDSSEETMAAAATAGGSGGAATALPPSYPQPVNPTTSNDSLGSPFGDVEEFTRDFGRIPSPPPLPLDFHSASHNSNGMLFNFSQFSQKLPRSQSQTRLDKSLSAVGLGMDASLESDLLYDHSDDGDLMQLLFGVPDEFPTMATIHLHKWSTTEEEEAEPGDNGSAAVRGSGSATVAGPGSTGGILSVVAAAMPMNPFDSSSRNPTPGSTPPQQSEQPQHPIQSGGHGQPGLCNGKAEMVIDGPEAHSHGPAPESYLVHGVGKSALAQLVNGLISNPSHTADEHHRDHLLDAETFRLLQSCD